MHRWARRLRDERGTVLLFVAITMTVLIGATALAVDIGQVTNNNRSLQGSADVISLDAARAVNGYQTAAELSGASGAVTLAVQASATRNNVPFSTLTVELGTNSGNTFTPIATSVLDGAIQTVTSTDKPTAVRVTAKGTVHFAFSPGGTTGARNAVASQTAIAGISVGSFLARVDTSTALHNSFLSSLVGGNVTLVGYTGIAAGSVNLGQLKTQLGFGTVDQLLDATITYKNLLNATAAALNAKGDTASLNARAAIVSIATAASSSLSLKLRNLINVATGDGNSAANADINVLQLAEMAAQVANGSNALSVTLSAASLGGFGSLLSPNGNSLVLKVIEPPQIAIGPAAQNASGQWVTTAHTAQVRLYIQLRPLTTVLGGVLNLPIVVEVASADASLRGITCADPVSNSTTSVHTDAQAVRARIGNLTDINASALVVADATILNVLGLVQVAGRADLTLAGSATDLTFHGPFDPNNRQTVGSTTLGLGGLLKPQLQLQLVLAGLGVGASVLTTVGNVLSPILDALDGGLLDRVLSDLGVIVGGADVTNFSLDCNPLRLVA